MNDSTHALVIGCSMAGMLHARVLADRFARVTVVERDALPESAEFRAGVPQARHVHALLAQGQEIMETLLPGLREDFTAIGAPRLTWGVDTAYLTAGGWLRRFNTGIEVNQASRPAIDFLIRKRMLALCPNVTILPETDVVGLTVEGARVNGVRLKARGGGEEETLGADLVVDASGRNSKAPEWLGALGCGEAPITEINSYIGYATRWYERPTPAPDWKTLFIVARPAEGILRGGAIFEVEGGRWIATLGGMNKDYPPTDEAAFLDYARTLATPAFYEAIRNARPLSPIQGYRIQGNRLRHYERLERWPERFIVTGDAVCAFNPLYGQGMTVAGIEALRLRDMLASAEGWSRDGFAARFQKGLAAAVRDPWLLATGEDLRYPGTEGAKPGALARLLQRYLDVVLRVMPEDEAVTMAFTRVANLSAPPASMLAPGIVWRVLRHRLAGGTGAQSRLDQVPARLVS